MKNKSPKITGPFPPRKNGEVSSFNPIRGAKVPKFNTSHISFPSRLRQFFTIKKLITLIAAALFGCISRYYLFFYFPDLSIYSFSFLLPTSLGSIFAGAIAGLYYDHLLGVVEMEDNKVLKDVDYSKLLMDNSGSNNGRGTFKNTIVELFNPVVEHLNHGARTLKYDELVQLNNQAQALGLFIITDINMTNKACTVTFLKPVSSLDNTAEVDLLKRLYLMFPNDRNYRSLAVNPTFLDEHRLQGCIRNSLDRANADPNSIYVSDQNKPAGVSPRFDITKPQGYYQPWASDIANSISRYKATNTNTNDKLNLDSYSTVFLLTFLNANPNMSPSSISIGRVVTTLKQL